ncbi:MAG: ABC transporter ATP-binding protein/permease [Caldilineaceae bacterium]|nr:ABC transporter ATP-binding protein/permease [Caldilineaceae bacterium]
MHLPFQTYGSLLARYVRPHWGKVALLALLLFATIGVQLLNPQIVRRFLDAAQAGSPLATLLWLALLFLGAALLGYLLTLATTYLSEDVGWRTTNALRSDLAAHCLRLDMSFHHRYTSGALIERVDGDVGQLAHFFSQLVIQFFGNLLLIAGILLVLAWEDWRLGLGFLGFVLGALAILFRLRNFATPAIQANRAASADLFGFLAERLGGAEELRANGAVAYTIQRLFIRLRQLWQTASNAALRNALYGSLVSLWFELGAVLALALGAFLFLRETITIGVVYLLYTYLRMVNSPLTKLTLEMQHLQEASAGITRINELLSESSPLTDGSQTTLPRGPLAVAFDQVRFNYGQSAGSGDGAPVLDDFSLNLPAGRTLGLLGRTGSGKTTITRLLLRLYDPQAGTVCLGGIDLRHLALSTLRRHVSVVTQDVQLFNATVRDNLTFFDRTISDTAIEAALARVGLAGWLRTLPAGLATELSAGGGSLSAGEAQLLAFARVLLKDPGVVILDEASSRLDPLSERRLDQAVERLLHNRTALIIAHRLATVQKVDDILILEAGRIAEYGPRAQLAADPHSRFAQLLRTGLDFEETSA